jgi:hypothetical protein
MQIGIIKNYMLLEEDNFGNSSISHFVSLKRVICDKSRRNFFLHVFLLYRFLPPVNQNLSVSVSKGKQLECAVQK